MKPDINKICTRRTDFYSATKMIPFIAYFFIKHYQIVCLIYIDILNFWHAICNWKLWNALWLYCLFKKNFHTYLTAVSLSNLHRLCVVLVHTFWYVDMPDVTAGYWRFADLIAFFGSSSYIIIFYIFIKLSHIVSLVIRLNLMTYVTVCYGRQTYRDEK